MELNKIYNEDCLEGMKNIPDKSVDLVVTDPWDMVKASTTPHQRKGDSIEL